jgi:hypothetical protein
VPPNGYPLYLGTDTGNIIKASIGGDGMLRFTSLNQTGPPIGEAILALCIKGRDDLLVLSGEFYEGRVALVRHLDWIPCE